MSYGKILQNYTKNLMKEDFFNKKLYLYMVTNKGY
jgi:hypothetical protein